ncbi:hypothetical protein CFC21_005399 [Triticum aestivum]|uniref:NB-ARC domain-containing protein n=2 Tax=Triticum aestivum TaxID=4565 RepID=A0A3B5YS16_WHEAT|nr:disease resistance protein Pik-2-like [Triticum aestivum]KAF6987789.1 hypothetical protein CFC21_005399 [Triticum aestivum]
MEEIVLGLSKTVVEGTLVKVKAAIDEEAKLKLAVQSDLVFITGEFEMMQSFLNVADAERIKNNAVKTWVRQLRDLAYDTEDCIELVVHLDPKPRWWRRLLVLPCLPAMSLPMDDAAAEIKELKDRVEFVSQRNMRYNLITDFGGARSVAQQQLDRAAGTAAALEIAVEAAAKKGRSLVDLTELIPKMEDRPELGVISVWGTGGDLGVASIVRKAYDDPEIRKNFQSRGWAKLTHPFNPWKILRSLLIQFCTNTAAPQKQRETLDVLLRIEKTTVEEGELVNQFVTHVNTHRFLVVLEGLSTMAEWDALRIFLPDIGNGSQIIVSTQHFDIASLCTGQLHKVSELRKFTHDHSVCVFFKEVSGGDDPGNAMLEVDDQTELIGRDTEQVELIGQIDEASRVISVWGIAGVGKSALVRSAYHKYVHDRPNLSGLNLSFIHGWVNVPHPFNLREFCRSLLLNLSSEPSKTEEDAVAELANMTNPIDVCRRLLSDDQQQNQCLIVVDDLQSTEEWDRIKQALSFGEGCCVIIVTNDSSVAKYCSGQDQKLMLNVKGLCDMDASDLFNTVYNDVSNHITRDEDMIKQSKLMLNKCGGLPKVIVAIGLFLAKSLNWEAMNTNFIHQLENNPDLASIHSLFTWLDSYFHNCPDELKPCIFYLSIFPRRHGIRRRRLVRRWIAEGYSRDTDGNLAEVNGENYFSRLVNLSMLTDAERGVNAAGTGTGSGRRMAMCNVNDFFREYIVSRRMEENHVFALEGRCSQTTRRTGRHLVIDQSWDGDENVFNRIEFLRLRSLTVFGSWKPFLASDKMRVLRVLDLEGTEGLTDNDIKNIVKRLPRLKFLSLRKCKNIFRLPKSLGRLRQLQTLDVRHTAIAGLPATVVKLQKLQYVRAGNTPGEHVGRENLESACFSCCPVGDHIVGVAVPYGIEKLTNLHTLGVIKATVAGLKELKKLTQLRKLGVSGINRSNHKELRAVVSGHGHLESLSIWLDKDTEGIDDPCLPSNDDFRPPEKLRRLKLHGHIGNLPAWVSTLTMLDLVEVSKSLAQDP